MEDIKEKKRVLVLSIPVWNVESGSDTFTNLLSGYDPDKIANIYFKSGYPTSSVCNNYFLINEGSVIKSIFNRKLKTGFKIDKSKSANLDINKVSQNEKRRYSFFLRHRWWIFLLARELLWKIGKWKSKELKLFIEEFKPEILFVPIEGYLYFNQVTLYLINRLNIPVIGYIWDDNFTYKVHPYNLGFRIHRFFLRRQVKEIISNCSQLFAISPKMQNELERYFNVEAEILTKGTIIQKKVRIEEKIDKPYKIVYAGKLGGGRFDTVRAVSDAIATINEEKKELVYEMRIYSGTCLSEKEIRQLHVTGTTFMGKVTQDKISEILESADILLFAEPMQRKHRYTARLSFSTKIVDYLAAQKCILAIGPKEIAPIEYLEKENSAIVISSKDRILPVLRNELDEKKVLRYAQRAQDLAAKNHNIDDIQLKLYETMK